MNAGARSKILAQLPKHGSQIMTVCSDALVSATAGLGDLIAAGRVIALNIKQLNRPEGRRQWAQFSSYAKATRCFGPASAKGAHHVSERSFRRCI
jgi:hypothetical protein